MTIVVKKVPKAFRGIIKFIFGIKEWYKKGKSKMEIKRRMLFSPVIFDTKNVKNTDSHASFFKESCYNFKR